MAKRTYLVTVFIATLSAEHGRLVNAIEALSNNDMQVVFRGSACASFLFNSAEAFDSIGRSIDAVTLSTDSFLLTEVGLRTWQAKLGRAAGWLRNHQITSPALVDTAVVVPRERREPRC